MAKLGRDSVHSMAHADSLRLSEIAGRKAMLRRRVSVVDVVGMWGCENPFDSMSDDMLEKELPVRSSLLLYKIKRYTEFVVGTMRTVARTSV